MITPAVARPHKLPSSPTGAAREAAAERAARIERLRAALARGDYQADMNAVAACMLGGARAMFGRSTQGALDPTVLGACNTASH